ncbi:MAG: aminotransferase class I/II-fold pyridoxal phosphate-dependent enzyme [Cloacibacillus evryensis]
MRDFICDKIKKIKPPASAACSTSPTRYRTSSRSASANLTSTRPGISGEEGIYSLHKGGPSIPRTPDSSSCAEIGRFMKRKYDLTYDPKHEMILTVGGEAIDIALRAILNPGDEVIYPEPCFVSYEPCILLSDGVPVSIELSAQRSSASSRNTRSGDHAEDQGSAHLLPEQSHGAIMERKILKARADHRQARPARHLRRDIQRTHTKTGTSASPRCRECSNARS